MDDFPGLFAKDFGIKPQGKSSPMAPPRNSASTGGGISDFGLRSDFGRSSYPNSRSANPIFDDHDRGDVGSIFNDVFDGPPKHSSESRASNAASSSLDYDAIFKDDKPNYSSGPVYDKPVYDDDIFDGLPGLKTSSVPSSTKYDDVFPSMSSPPQTKKKVQNSSPFDDLLGGIGRKDAEVKNQSQKVEKDPPSFDDLLPGFGRSTSPVTARSTSESKQSQKPFSNSTKNASNFMEDPFVVLETKSAPADSSAGVFTDPLEEISELNGSVKTKVGTGGVSDDIDPLGSFARSVPLVRSESNYSPNDGSPHRTNSRSGIHKEPPEKENNESYNTRRTLSDDDVLESPQTAYDMPNVSTNYWQSSGQTTSPPPYTSRNNDTSTHVNSARGSMENSESLDDIWLTVSEVPLFTQPTSGPPPSRPPPPRPPRLGKSERGSFSSTNARRTNFPSSEFSEYSHSPQATTVRSTVDELEDFAMGGTRNSVNEHPGAFPEEDFDASSAAAASAAAMKEAMDKAEVKFRHAKEMRERENLRASRNRDQFDENLMQDANERELKERQERLERDRQQREKEEEREKAHRRLEKEREQVQREREKGRQAVERATREARERAAIEARVRAEKAAVEKASGEARERAERAAVQRAQAEARERAAAEARERAERAASEAREREAREKAKAAGDVRLRAERAAVERAAAEARERAAAGARERAAAAARVTQQKNVNDLDDFFNLGRASSAPRPRSNSSDPLFETQNKAASEAARRTSVESSSSMKKASSTANIVDDLTSIFGGATSSAGDFNEIDGESEERRRARMERHQRTQERAAKALDEKNQRDLAAQREQAERHRIAETLDIEIKRWAAGKEANLRALLSTLQYVLWPECGWQPVSLTDLITAASVKKVYRKATLCIHPDKVQQKGANLQQKYIAEKVFDLLKEAWNKFNSEELF